MWKKTEPIIFQNKPELLKSFDSPMENCNQIYPRNFPNQINNIKQNYFSPFHLDFKIYFSNPKTSCFSPINQIEQQINNNHYSNNETININDDKDNVFLAFRTALEKSGYKLNCSIQENHFNNYNIYNQEKETIREREITYVPRHSNGYNNSYPESFFVNNNRVLDQPPQPFMSSCSSSSISQHQQQIKDNSTKVNNNFFHKISGASTSTEFPPTPSLVNPNINSNSYNINNTNSNINTSIISNNNSNTNSINNNTNYHHHHHIHSNSSQVFPPCAKITIIQNLSDSKTHGETDGDNEKSIDNKLKGIKEKNIIIDNKDKDELKISINNELKKSKSLISVGGENKKQKIIFECSGSDAATSSSCKSHLKKKRFRKNNEQLIHLSSFYSENKNWSKKQIKEISEKIGLKENKIYKWLWDQKNKEFKANKFIVNKDKGKCK